MYISHPYLATLWITNPLQILQAQVTGVSRQPPFVQQRQTIVVGNSDRVRSSVEETTTTALPSVASSTKG